MESTDPGLTGIAGDWHGNTRWAVSAIRQICERLHEESPKIILQAGDFGISDDDGTYRWKGETCHRQTYLEALEEVLQDNDAQLWFVDGNHENHDFLARIREELTDDPLEPVPLVPSAFHVYHLPRGYRWSWHGRTWMALGGAVSVDKNLRTEGISWFPQEEVTDAQEAAAVSGGRIDVLLSHDAPTDVPLSLGTPPLEWLPMIPRAEAHRRRFQYICEAVKPSVIFHGHYHMPGDRVFSARWGTCHAISLDCDGTQGNWGILDTRTMEWEW